MPKSAEVKPRDRANGAQERQRGAQQGADGTQEYRNEGQGRPDRIQERRDGAQRIQRKGRLQNYKSTRKEANGIKAPPLPKIPARRPKKGLLNAVTISYKDL